MRYKKLLGIVLLSLSFCLVSGAGYGEIIIPEHGTTLGELLTWKVLGYENEPLWPFIRRMCEEMREEIGLLKLYDNLFAARINYMMRNPTTYLDVNFFYDRDGKLERSLFPEGVETKNKISVDIADNMDIFSDKSGIALLDEFKRNLEVIYSYIKRIATNMDTDIVAVFYSREGIELGYFYQGEYHLWDE